MLSTESELQALKEERRRSAAKVRSLLVQLEAAEKEFNAITEKMKTFRVTESGAGDPQSAPPVIHGAFCGSATPRA